MLSDKFYTKLQRTRERINSSFSFGVLRNIHAARSIHWSQSNILHIADSRYYSNSSFLMVIRGLKMPIIFFFCYLFWYYCKKAKQWWIIFDKVNLDYLLYLNAFFGESNTGTTSEKCIAPSLLLELTPDPRVILFDLIWILISYLG